MITTTKGMMDGTLLVKTTGEIDNENEHTTWVEYREPGSDEIIHRSVNIVLKKPAVLAEGAAANLI